MSKQKPSQAKAMKSEISQWKLQGQPTLSNVALQLHLSLQMKFFYSTTDVSIQHSKTHFININHEEYVVDFLDLHSQLSPWQLRFWLSPSRELREDAQDMKIIALKKLAQSPG